MPDLATLEHSGRIARLTLNRPEQRNALSVDLLAALHAHVDALPALADQGVSVLVITGAGKAFCAGMDLKAVLGNDAVAANLLRSLAELTNAIRALPMVTLASVNGAAIGGGCGLACVCDIAVTHADAKLGFPEVTLGVCPAVVAPWLVRKTGAGPARRLLLTGGLLSGQEAFSTGMVDHLAQTADDLAALTNTIAERLASGGPHALRATKSLLNRIEGSDDGSLVLRGAQLSAQILAMPQTQATLRAKLNG
jgi:enoyl-CoA hydratase/carnithine racemase